MFTESMIVSNGGRRHGRRPAAFAAAVATHILVIGLLVVIPLLYSSSLPDIRGAGGGILVMLPPSPPPPPPGPPAAARREQPQRPPEPPKPPKPESFQAPSEIPDTIEDVPIELDTNEWGVVGGYDPAGGGGGGTGDGPAWLIGPPAPPIETTPVRVPPAEKPQLVHKIDPVYPVIMAAARASGIVIIDAVTDSDGRVAGMTVLRATNKLFEEAALDAVRQWRYKPYFLNGRPHPVVFTVTVEFKIR